ncbi:hypothetical protein F4820DRAFT_434815 [Hypoxylon rubiginosum]|uniref:Uncharacterized protein n=1 Tax=Hypoxylon rubiginosum TaxID=110542 RepID=A0ACB9YQ37_9PEZI|nr:hypothetical protein F4820DRAFT_434815 [Hypoxylon rubiginosum]
MLCDSAKMLATVDGSQGPPPTYNETLDRTTTDQSDTAVQIQPTPGPARSGMVFWDAPGEIFISFRFKPKPSMDDKHQPWFAQMGIKYGDVPLLMREGFHWTTANVVREDGFVGSIDRRLVNLRKVSPTCTITMFWTLQDLQRPPRWTAYLQVHAPNYAVISGIRLENWTTDMVTFAEARSLSRDLIYRFDASMPTYHFNSIYDDMPLKGWWPWPKEDSSATKTR